MPSRYRKPVSIPQPVGPEKDFLDHTKAVYSFMEKRFGEKRKNGVIVRLAIPIPFTLPEFRAWLLLEYFGGRYDNTVRCRYCKTWMNALTFVVDHLTPVAQGGSLDLCNLGLCCAACNTAKGAMTAEGFAALCEFAVQLSHADRSDLLSRMKNGAAYLKLKIAAGKAGTSLWRRR